MESRFVRVFFARGAELAAEGDWHREAILACASRLAKAKPLLAAGCSSCQKWSPYLFLNE
jgi:hypothetical protein